jgi:uncharacterized protein YndB with AHSA1/START domain
MPFLPVLAAVLTLSGTVDPAWIARLEAGEIALDVHPDPRGQGGEVRAVIDIAAPPAIVWGAILDCERAARMTPSVKRCRVLSRTEDGRSEMREHLVRWSFLAPAIRSFSRLELDPRRTIRFRCTGGDIKVCDGSWRLEPLAGGRSTRVIYENRATAPYALPAGFVTMAMRRDVPAALKALRRESLEASR